ncbi:probable RNA-binding protein 46 [Culicoides brevitarsis]|uniref:probable RNA-binding protein 46 n=1 Tax=Culicoides brevitarsis TaxID=469753 RepID=UPI00307BAF69
MHLMLVNGLIYPVSQINGQRITGPPENLVWNEPAYETNEVFVTNLPRTVFEDTLLPLFSRCGIVYKIRLMMCFSGTNRGFAYVLFATQAAAQTALLFFARFPLFDRFIFAHKSSNKRILLMGNINCDKSTREIINFCFEMTKCVDAIRVNDAAGKLKFLLLIYKCHYDAAMARRLMTTCLFDFGERCYVKWYNKRK